MSLLLRLLVPLATSRCSSSPVLRPRVTASSAVPTPTMPPPTTSTSSSGWPASPSIAASAASRAAGPRALGCVMPSVSQTDPRAEGRAVVGDHRVPRPGGVDDGGVDLRDRHPLLVTEPHERPALGVVDGRAADELVGAAPAGQTREHDVHAVLDRSGGVVEVATMGATGEVRRGGEVADRTVEGRSLRVLGEAAVVADRQAELEPVDGDRGAVVADGEDVLLEAVEVLLVVRRGRAAVGPHHDLREPALRPAAQRRARDDDHVARG